MGGKKSAVERVEGSRGLQRSGRSEREITLRTVHCYGLHKHMQTNIHLRKTHTKLREFAQSLLNVATRSNRVQPANITIKIVYVK